MKRLCPVCHKKRDPHLFPPYQRMCELCKIAKRSKIKIEKREASPKTWIKRLDKLIGDRVRSRGFCEATERHHRGVLQWAHIISRSYHNTRWMESNAFCLCAGCHKYYTNRPLEWEQFVILKKGERRLSTLKFLALKHKKMDYKNLYKQLCNQETSGK